MLEDLYDFITNKALLVPLFSWMIAQILKTLIDAAIHKTFRPSRLFGDGGMPSGHSATVMSLAMYIGLETGFDTFQFAIAMIFAIVVMHDASGVRREAGKQARMILSIVDAIGEYINEKDLKIKDEKLKVLVGHTPLQVTCGALLGAAVAIIFHLFV